MKVKELIKALEGYNPEVQVYCLDRLPNDNGARLFEIASLEDGIELSDNSGFHPEIIIGEEVL